MPNKRGQPVIAIDGTSASGKSTLSKQLAEHYGARRIEYSRFFRLIAHHMKERGYDPEAEPTPEQVKEAVTFAEKLDWNYIEHTKDLDLNTLEISRITPKFSGREGVIKATDAILITLIDASSKPVIAEGRTIGKFSYPASDVKLYVTADVEVRAIRRHAELVEKHGSQETVEKVEADLRSRDERDQSRAVQPTGYDPDVHSLLDTTHTSKQATLEAAKRIIEAKLPPLAEQRYEQAQGLR